MLAPWKKSYDKPRQHIKKQRHHFASKGPYSQSYGFSSSHVRMWELDYKEGWTLKNWCFLITVLEKTLESPLDSKEIKSVNLNGDQHWIFPGRTDNEAETLVFWSSEAKKMTHCKNPWCSERLRTEEEEDIRGWDGCMPSPMQWTWTWANFEDKVRDKEA